MIPRPHGIQGDRQEGERTLQSSAKIPEIWRAVPGTSLASANSPINPLMASSFAGVEVEEERLPCSFRYQSPLHLEVFQAWRLGDEDADLLSKIPRCSGEQIRQPVLDSRY
eukprot:GHVS01034529.1.p2 GENE.GHVS01034529.1~~GHVS01034529.1.p2  ORF type:complete len:111 (-),score=4.99 GHVS01034529.1:3-335(-)